MHNLVAVVVAQHLLDAIPSAGRGCARRRPRRSSRCRWRLCSPSRVSTRTTSPRAKPPEADTMPAGSSDFPARTSARTAPSSTVMRPRSRSPDSRKRRRLSRRSTVGRKCVPTGSPLAARWTMSASRPSAITTCAPDCVASRAASTFVAMPPVPRWPACPAAASSIAGPMWSTCSMSPGVGVRRGVRGVEPGRVGEQEQQVGVDEVGDLC